MQPAARSKPILFPISAVFLGLFALVLTLAPAARARSWDVEYQYAHWVGYLVWLVGFGVANRLQAQYLPNRDAYLFPVISLLSGWGLLTIWRLTPTFGLRQTLWLGVALIIFSVGLVPAVDLKILRRYKYIWLTSGLLLMFFTLIFGTNPLGYGPRLWLGCCGVYLQPSEPLKLLLILYLAAYFADWQAYLKIAARKIQVSQIQILIPTAVMTGLALLLLLVQRDLGTASVFIFLYSVMIYLATGWPWAPVLSVGALAGASLLGYLIFDVIRLRVDAWLNPWLDPAGRSYQIVQSLIAIANGGLWGRGPGLGNPGLVPVAHSDFVFVAIAEETGLVGVMGFLILLAFLIQRGLRLAMRAPDFFQRLLAAGLTAFIIAQSVLIMGGNLRLLPLTGVTLPFVSYGGSSLVVSFSAALILLKISANTTSQRPERQTVSLAKRNSQPILHLALLLLLALMATSLISGWWAFWRGPDLLTRTDNPRRGIADQFVPRGTVYDRQGIALAETVGRRGALLRQMNVPDLAPVVGYNHPVYGQTGLEASLDAYLRGVQGYPSLTIWQHHLLYGQPPPGLDIRLTIDLGLQQNADAALTDHTGAALVLNAENGEILVMASHPTYDPNLLAENWDSLIVDPTAPLLNRATQGVYPAQDLLRSLFGEVGPDILGARPTIRLPLAETNLPADASPFEIAILVAAAESDHQAPAPQIAQMVANPAGGWVLLPRLGLPLETNAVLVTALQTRPWQIAVTPEDEDLTWFVAATTTKNNIPLIIVLVLEEANLELAETIGAQLLKSAILP